jgi:carboxymethylenebutenolidase
MQNKITLMSADGHQFSCYISKPKQPNKEAIILIHEIFGITKQMQELSEYYSSLGFTTIIPALFDRSSKDTVISYDEPKKGLAIVSKLSKQSILLDIQAAIEHLDNERVSIIGYCWGGGIAYLTACELALYSGASFYGTRLESYLPKKPKCQFQFHFGELDDHSPKHVIDTMKDATSESEFYIYPDAGHAFANSHRPSFNDEANELSQAHLFKMIK